MPAKIAIGLFILILINPIGLYGQTGSALSDRFDLAVSELDKGNYEEALARFETLRERSCLEESLYELCLDSKIKLVITKRRLNDFESAKQLLDRAEHFAYDKLSAHPDYMATIYLFMIYMDEELPGFDSAAYAEKLKEIVEMEDVKPVTTLKAAIGVGYHEDSSGNYHSAIDSYKIGLNAVKNEKHNDTIGRFLIQAYNNLGVSYRRLGMPEKAMEMYQLSIDRIYSVHGPGHLSLEIGYNNVGTIYYGMGDYGRATEYFLRSAAIIERIFGKNNSRMGVALNNAGVSMSQLGNYEMAAKYLEEAQRVKEATQGEYHIDTAVGYSNLASIHILNKAFDKAETNYLRSIEVRKKIEGDNHPILIEPKTQLALFYLERERHEDARAQLTRALEVGISRLGSSHPNVADIYYTFGKSYKQQGYYSESIDYFKTALTSIYGEYKLPDSLEPERIISAPVKFVNILQSKAKVYRLLYKTDPETDYLYKALDCLAWSMEMVDYLQMSYQNEASKLNLINNNYSIYTEKAEIISELYHQNRDPAYLDQIFSVMEESRARIAHELLQNVTARTFAGVPEEVIGQERQLNSVITQLYQQLSNEQDKGLEMNRALISQLRDSLFYAQRELEKFTRDLEAAYPSYYKLKYESKVIGKEKAKEMLGNNNTLLSYMISDNNIFVFLLSAEHSKFVKLAETEGMQSRVSMLRKAVTGGNTGDFTKLAYELYTDLIEPVKPYLNTESITIVADQMLHLLPFEMLLTEKTGHTQYRQMPYLIREYGISYAPSVTIMEMMLNRKQKNPRNLLAIAPFAHQPEGETVLANFERNGENLEPLLLTGYETRKIGEIFSTRRTLTEFLFPNRTEILLSSNATETEVLNRLGNYNYLHFATHAFINEENPAMSGIALYPEPGSNGIAYLGDIYNMEMNADLVVLGACDTGLGSVYKGEGMIGFARAFIYAGAANLTVSMWRVNDQPTALLMIAFYEQIRNGNNYSESLRQAKLTLIDNPATAAPRNWAAFVLHGR